MLFGVDVGIFFSFLKILGWVVDLRVPIPNIQIWATVAGGYTCEKERTWNLKTKMTLEPKGTDLEPFWLSF